VNRRKVKNLEDTYRLQRGLQDIQYTHMSMSFRRSSQHTGDFSSLLHHQIIVSFFLQKIDFSYFKKDSFLLSFNNNVGSRKVFSMLIFLSPCWSFCHHVELFVTMLIFSYHVDLFVTMLIFLSSCWTVVTMSIIRHRAHHFTLLFPLLTNKQVSLSH